MATLKELLFDGKLMCGLLDELRKPGWNQAADNFRGELERLPAGKALSDDVILHLQDINYVLKNAEQLINESVFEHLDAPPIVTLYELREAIRAFLMMEGGQFDWNSFTPERARQPFTPGNADADRYSRFVEVVLAAAGRLCRSEPIPVMSGTIHPFQLANDLEIWRGHSAFRIFLTGCLPASAVDHEHHVKPMTVYATAEGACSIGAMVQLSGELRRVLQSLFNSFVCIADHERKVKQHREKDSFLDPVVICKGQELVGDFKLIPACVAAFYAGRTDEDSIDRRIRNALHLLVESDAQRHPGVRLGLIWAALEAMVCYKQKAARAGGKDAASERCNEPPGPTRQLKYHLAALVVRDSSQRPSARKWIDHQYNDRCDVLHGRSIDKEASAASQARLLSAYALRAMLERREFMEKRGWQGTSAEPSSSFIEELRRCEETDWCFPGVRYERIEGLW